MLCRAIQIYECGSLIGRVARSVAQDIERGKSVVEAIYKASLQYNQKPLEEDLGVGDSCALLCSKYGILIDISGLICILFPYPNF